MVEGKEGPSPERQSEMNASLQSWLRWTPRALAIAFALFLSLFALDVFNEHLGIVQTITALFIHLTPVWLILGALAIAWRWEAAGGILFLALAGWYAVMSANHPISWFLVIGTPAMLIGALFLLSAWFRGRRRLSTAGTN